MLTYIYDDAIMSSETRTEEVNKLPFNYDELKREIRKKFGKQEDFARKLGIGRVSLSLRLNNKAQFSQGEINKSCDLLEIERKDIPKYFFCTESSETRTNNKI